MVALRKALKFTAAPNPQRMSKEFDGFCAENKLFHSTFSPQGKTGGVLSRGFHEAAQKSTSATGARVPILNRNACLTF
jgi:hypothetical protein